MLSWDDIRSRVMDLIDARLKSTRHENADHLDRALLVRKLKPGTTADQVIVTDGTTAAWGAVPATSGPPTGAAGGVLSGTYPNPGFAADMATQAELDAHTSDTSDAHDASAISILDTGARFTATDTEAALEELDIADVKLEQRIDDVVEDFGVHHHDSRYWTLSTDLATQTELDAHINDTSAAHAASAISVSSTTLVGTGTDVQAVFEELDNAIVAAETATSNHLADTTDAHDASAISVLDTGARFVATDTEAALEELDVADAKLEQRLDDLTEDLGVHHHDSRYAASSSITDHLADTADAHAASAITNTAAGTISSTTVQAAINELDTEKATTGSVSTVASDLATHIADATDAHAGTAITNTPAGTVSATTVQAAINELDSEKAPITSPTFLTSAFAPTVAIGVGTNLATIGAVNTALGAYLTTAAAAAAYQPLDADLTTIAALDSGTSAGVMGTEAAGWVKRTYAQVKTSLGLVKADVGLGNVDNTSDANKPVSTAQQTALDLKANLAGPTFTGVVTLPTGTVGVTQLTGDNDTSVATTGFVQQEITVHTSDSSAAHAASAISADSTTLVGTGTTVQAVFEELDNAIVAAETSVSDHLSDATAAHAGTAISNTPAGSIAATTVQAAINELDGDVQTAQSTADNHIADGTAAHNASAIAVSDIDGYYAGANVESVLQEIGAGGVFVPATGNSTIYGSKSFEQALRFTVDAIASTSSDSQVLGATDRYWIFTGATPVTWSTTADPTGLEWLLINNGSATVTLDPDGADTVNGASTLDIPPGEAIWLVGTSSTTLLARFMGDIRTDTALSADQTFDKAVPVYDTTAGAWISERGANQQYVDDLRDEFEGHHHDERYLPSFYASMYAANSGAPTHTSNGGWQKVGSGGGTLTWTSLFDVRRSGVSAQVDTATNKRIDIRQTGVYRVGWSATFGSIADAKLIGVSVYKNGAAAASDVRTSGLVTAQLCTGTKLLSLTSGDYLELYAYQNDSASEAYAVSEQYYTYLECEYIGPAS